jgi:hypothetical protein
MMTKSQSNGSTTIAGLDEDTYNKTATGYAKGAVWMWLIAGLIFNLVTGKLISLSSVLLIVPGVFVVAFAVIPLFLLSIKKRKSVQLMKDLDHVAALSFSRRSHSKDVPIMLAWTLVTVIEWVFPAALAILAMSLLHNI